MDQWAVSYEHGINPSDCIKCRNFLTTEQLLVYQEGLCSVELVRDDSRVLLGLYFLLSVFPSLQTVPRLIRGLYSSPTRVGILMGFPPGD
jgi:hypothetical protein